MVRKVSPWLMGLAFGVSLVNVGCVGDEQGAASPVGPDGGSGSLGPSHALCTRDPGLLAQPHLCTRDDDCPCGSACNLGACSSQCLADTDCGPAFVCDGYGRCASPALANQPLLPGESPQAGAPADAGAQAPPPVPLSDGTLTIDRTALDLLNAGLGRLLPRQLAERQPETGAPRRPPRPADRLRPRPRERVRHRPGRADPGHHSRAVYR